MDQRGPIILTGAAGFIGSHVAQRLVSEGRSVVGIDNFDPYYDPRLKRRNLELVAATAGPGRFEFSQTDITDPGALDALLARVRPEGVIHLAAKAGVRPSIADPVGYARANVLGTSIVLEAARLAGCSRIVIASSSSVYGNCPEAPFAEDMDVSEPISPYAATKRACELLGFTHHRLTGMPTAMLRFFTVYGPRQRPDLAIELFMRRLAAGQPIAVFGRGDSSRDYTFISDIVDGILAAYRRIPEVGYRVWNLGSDRPVTLDDMVTAIGRVAGVTPRVERGPARAGDVERTWADLTRARGELGYTPRTSFDDGLRAQWEWIRANPS